VTERESSEVLVGLDVGTSAVKAVALGLDGRVLAGHEVAYPLAVPQPGWAEQDPEDWWQAAEEALSAVTGTAEVLGLGLSGQMHGLVALDSGDRVIRPAILWNDQRTAVECEEIATRVGERELIALTGNRALTGFTAPKLLWMRKHEPEAYARIARVMLPKDYVRLRLCGEHATDVADASGTLLLDVAGRSWSGELLEALEIEREWLPRLLECPQPSGTTRDGVVVAAGAGDQAAGALGVGVLRPGPLSVVLGTSGVVLIALDAFRTHPGGRVHAFCHAAPDAWQAMGVMLSAGGALTWLRETIAPDVAFDALMAEAECWEPGAGELTFLPYLAGERTPHDDPLARGAFTGLSLHHDRGALVRAALEGVACGLRDCADLVLGLDATQPRVARASGGGARSDLWLAIVASVLEMPIERLAVEEGAAFGAALMGGVAAGVWPDVDEATASTVRVREVIEPDPAWVPRYRELQERYRALYPATISSAGSERSGEPGAGGRRFESG
jgi:xylulokinase